MAKDTEIEKRYIVKDKDNLRTELESSGEKTFQHRQIDDYYIPPHRDFLAEKYPFEWLRLRHANDKHILTYKHWYPQRVPLSTHCDEYETEISDVESFVKILESLNFEKIVTVDKKRTSYDLQNFEISIDDVKKVGVFVEVEIKDSYESVEEALNQIDRLAKKLKLEELPENHQIRSGYPLAIYKKEHAKD